VRVLNRAAWPLTSRVRNGERPVRHRDRRGRGNCNLPGSVASGASCTIGITFTPTADQAYTGSIVLDSNANSSPSTINLSGTGTGTGTPPPAPVASLSPNPLAFTDQVAGTTSEPMQATLSNSGNAALSYSVSISGAGFASVTGTSACGTTGSLVAGSSCFIYATFTPTSATSFSGSIQVTDNKNAADDTAPPSTEPASASRPRSA